jgi:hypothetical protein
MANMVDADHRCRDPLAAFVITQGCHNFVELKVVRLKR